MARLRSLSVGLALLLCAGCSYVPKSDYSRVLAQYESAVAENRNLQIENENLRTSWRDAVDARVAAENEASQLRNGDSIRR